MITLKPLQRTEGARVAHLVLPDTQADFVGPIADMVGDPDPHVRLHVAVDQGQIVGFFKIDLDFSRIATHLPKGTFGLRGLLIGGQYQGQGYGRMLLDALPDYLRNTYPKANDIWLSVDVSNTIATRCYENAGWVMTGPKRNGRCWKEHVMMMQLAEKRH